MALHLHTDKVRTTTLPHAVIPQSRLEDKRYSRVKEWPVSHKAEEVDMPSSALTVIESNLRDRREQSTRKPRKNPLNCSLLTIQGRSPSREWNLPYVRSTFTGPIDESNCTAVESRATKPSSSIALDIGIHNDSWGGTALEGTPLALPHRGRHGPRPIKSCLRGSGSSSRMFTIGRGSRSPHGGSASESGSKTATATCWQSWLLCPRRRVPR
jgi:hypothetical protein